MVEVVVLEMLLKQLELHLALLTKDQVVVHHLSHLQLMEMLIKDIMEQEEILVVVLLPVLVAVVVPVQMVLLVMLDLDMVVMVAMEEQQL